MVLFKQIVFKCQENVIYCSTTEHMRGDLKTFNIQTNHAIIDRIGKDCEEKSTKFLGMRIEENLTRKYHVNEVKNKVAKLYFQSNK